VASKHRLSVNLSQNEYQELTALAEKHQVSMAWLGRQAIQEFLSRYRQEELQLPLKLTREQ
jgi:predicted transcriptional regulator